MEEDLSPIALARLASALTMDDAATITGMSKSTYAHAEEHPLELTLGEFRALSKELNADGRKVLQEWIASSFVIMGGA